MPLQIIRQDITKIKCDAIVNPSNEKLLPTGGTDLTIHNAAGPKLLEQCRLLDGCPTGEAKITNAFKLPCRYVIHTAGPVWQNGNENEHNQLSSCYRNCLTVAKENNCTSVAFPLISSGLHGFPKDQVLKIAINTISSFLFDNEMTVYLVVFDKTAYELSEKLFAGIEEYIDDNYVIRNSHNYNESTYSLNRRSIPETDFCCASMPVPSGTKKRLDEYIKLDESFAEKLIKIIDAKGLNDVACYKKANVSKQTWHKLMTDKFYKPNKKTAVSFAVALELSLEETQNLLASVGFILSDSSLFDVIIKYCLENNIYDIWEIDSVLFKYDQETLFSTL